MLPAVFPIASARLLESGTPPYEYDAVGTGTEAGPEPEAGTELEADVEAGAEVPFCKHVSILLRIKVQLSLTLVAPDEFRAGVLLEMDAGIPPETEPEADTVTLVVL